MKCGVAADRRAVDNAADCLLAWLQEFVVIR